MKKTNKKGFTIVELVIVIAVIAILAAVLIPTFAGVVERANKSAATSAARNCYTELMAYTNADVKSLVKSGDSITVVKAGTVTGTLGDGYTAAEVAAFLTETGVDSITVTSAGLVTFVVGSYQVTSDALNVASTTAPAVGG